MVSRVFDKIKQVIGACPSCNSFGRKTNTKKITKQQLDIGGLVGGLDIDEVYEENLDPESIIILTRDTTTYSRNCKNCNHEYKRWKELDTITYEETLEHAEEGWLLWKVRNYFKNGNYAGCVPLYEVSKDNR